MPRERLIKRCEQRHQYGDRACLAFAARWRPCCDLFAVLRSGVALIEGPGPGATIKAQFAHCETAISAIVATTLQIVRHSQVGIVCVFRFTIVR